MPEFNYKNPSASLSTGVCVCVALTMGVISVHSYCWISILFSLLNIILLKEQQAASKYVLLMDIAFLQGQAASSLTVYHCTPHSMCLSVISYLKNLEVLHVLLGPYFIWVLLVSFLPIVAYFAISYVPASTYYWCIPPQYCTYTCVSPWHWPAIDIRSYIEPRGAQLATLALDVVTYSTVWTAEPN